MTATEASSIIIALAALVTAVAGLVAAFRHQRELGALGVTTNSLQHENARLNRALGTAQGLSGNPPAPEPAAPEHEA